MSNQKNVPQNFGFKGHALFIPEGYHFRADESVQKQSSLLKLCFANLILIMHTILKVEFSLFSPE